MPYADPEKKRAYLRAYKAAKRAERVSAPKSPVAVREGRWASGHSDLARCLTCALPITTKPTTCTEPKHLDRYNQRRERNNAYRREQRQKARAAGQVKRYGSPDAKKAQSKRDYQKRRVSILNRLGGVCLACGIADHRVLQAHHRHGGGRKERDAMGWRYHGSVYRLSDTDLRLRFKLLCANCHQIEHHHEADQDSVEPSSGV